MPRVAHATRTRPRARGHAPSNPLDTIGRNLPLPLPVPDWSKPIIIALLALAAWLGVRGRLAALRARRLEGQRATLLADVDTMQAALAPAVPARLEGLAVSVAYRPAAGPAAGGDFYDLFVLEPGRVAIMLGDVAGHGDEALAQAALTRYTLRAYLQAGLEPRKVLALAGQVLVDPGSERFATVGVGVFDTHSGRLTYALAGHPPPIVHGSQAREPVTSCSSPALGWSVPTGRRQTTVSLPAGAQACFFSDGLIEARCAGGLLGRERLSEILVALGPRPQAADLLERVRSAAAATPDDMVACILAPQAPAGARLVHVEELEADARELSGVQARRFLDDCEVPAREIARTLELADAIAAASGTALLRVERGPTGAATARATAPGPGAGQAAPRGAPPAAQPLLAASSPPVSETL